MVQAKSKSKSRPAPKQTITMSKSAVAGSENHPWVEMLTDPFDAPSAQIPDAWPYPTQATKLKMTIDVTTDAAGYAALAIGHSLASYQRVFTVTGGVLTATNTATQHNDKVAYSTAFDRSRVTCGGVSFVNFVTPETSMGMCSSQLCPEESIGGYTTDALTIATIMNDGEMQPISEGLTSYVFPLEEPQFSTSHVYWSSLPTLLFLVRGAKPSTTIGQLECVLNIEGVADPSSVHAGGSTVEPYDPVAHTIGTHVSQSGVAANTAGGKYAPRRLTAHDRAVADLSASLFGFGLGGATGAAVAQSPAAIREARKRLKKLMAAVKA